jgi:hypothetical protein
LIAGDCCEDQEGMKKWLSFDGLSKQLNAANPLAPHSQVPASVVDTEMKSSECGN